MSSTNIADALGGTGGKSIAEVLGMPGHSIAEAIAEKGMPGGVKKIEITAATFAAFTPKLVADAVKAYNAEGHTFFGELSNTQGFFIPVMAIVVGRSETDFPDGLVIITGGAIGNSTGVLLMTGSSTNDTTWEGGANAFMTNQQEYGDSITLANATSMLETFTDIVLTLYVDSTLGA